MMRAQPRRPRSPSHRAIPATPEARRYPPEGQPASARKPTDRTSKSAIPTIDPTRRHGCSGPHRPPTSRSPHGYERCILPMDAKDKGPYAPQSYGRLSSRCTIVAGRIRALTALPPITPTSPAGPPHGSLTPADAPLINAEKPFRKPGPPQNVGGRSISRRFVAPNSLGCPGANRKHSIRDLTWAAVWEASSMPPPGKL
jgi:hypothetical protein